MDKKLLALLLASVQVKVDFKGLAHGIIDELVEPAVKAAVKKTDTKIDDMVVATLYQNIEDGFKELVDAKILVLEELIKKKIDELKKA